jgi:sensor histidine kinase YesM
MGFKKTIITLFVTYALVLAVNITANYELYKTGEYWQFSIPFSLSVATIGWLGYMLMYKLFFKNYLDTKRNPNVSLLLSVIISGLYGVLLMLLVMRSLVWFFHHEEQPIFNYTNNALYAALLAMLLGLIVNGQDFLKQLKTSAEENERMKKDILQAQYQALKNQVSPHFFFNTLNTLATLIPEDPVVAVNFVHQLSKVFRYSLQTGDEKTVSLETELKVVQAYLFLNEQRFNGKLSASVSVSDEALPMHIVPHALLMLVENGVKHNEISSAYPLTIHVFNEQNKYLVVANNYKPKKQTEISTGLGLNNITERYKLLTDNNVVIEIDNNFTVKIPLLKNEHSADRG